jgi:hypothetical protein
MCPPCRHGDNLAYSVVGDLAANRATASRWLRGGGVVCASTVRVVLIWINGPFGGGKTTLARELLARWPRARLFDPELVGFMVREMVPPAGSGDFQDLPVWRDLVVQTARVLLERYRCPLVVPMTVVEPDYLGEIFGGLDACGVPVRHVFVEVGAAELRRRIEAQRVWPDDPERDGQVREWRLAQVQRGVAATAALPPGTAVLDGELPTAALADRVVRLTSSAGQPVAGR